MTDGGSGWDKALGDEVLERSTFTRNVGQQFLVVTRDRVELTLMKFQGALRSRSEWHTPAGMLITLVATLAAAQFHEALGVPSPVWEAGFFLAAIGCGVWLAVALIRVLRTRTLTVDTVIDQLWKASTDSVPSKASPNEAMQLTEREPR